VEGILWLALVAILSLKLYAYAVRESLRRSFAVASGAELLYLTVALLGMNAAGSVILHLEYQAVFRLLAFVLMGHFIKISGSDRLSAMKGIGWNRWGALTGFALLGSLGVSLVTSKQLILNALTQNGYFEAGYLLVAINLAQALYLVSLFETLVVRRHEKSWDVSAPVDLGPVGILGILGVLVFVWPDLYLVLPHLFAPIESFHLSFAFATEGVGAVFVATFLVVMAGVALYSIESARHDRRFYFGALAVLTLALVQIVSAESFEGFYLYWELMTFSSYLLIMYSREDRAVDAARLYLLMCIGGAYLLQLAFSHFFSVGATAFTQVRALDMTVAVLLVLGFGVKAGIVPLHAWLPVAHPEAPSSISAPLSGVLTKAGVFGLITLIFVIGYRTETLSWVLIAVGLVTLVYGEVRTLFENDLKRLLAYSTIGQIGEIVTILGIGSALALSGALYHVVNHAIAKDLLFLSVGVLMLAAKSRKLDDLRGAGRFLGWAGVPMGIGIFALAALPPFGNFNSKFLMIDAAVSSGAYAVAFVMIAASVVGFVAMLRVFRYLFLMKPVRPLSPVSAPLRMLVLWGFSALSILSGIFGGTLSAWIGKAVGRTLHMAVMLPDLSLPLPVSVLWMLSGAVVVYLFGRSARQAGLLAAVFSAVAFVALFVAPMEAYGRLFGLLITFMAVVNFVYAAGYMAHSRHPERFFATFMIMIAGLLGAALCDGLYAMFFYWEIMGGWALYLALVHEEDDFSVSEATKYLIYNYAGAGVLMIAIATVGRYGWSFASLHGVPMNSDLMFGVVLLVAAFLAKAAQLPIRIDYQMHPKPAPTPISGYISSVMLKSGPFMMAKAFFIGAAGAGAVSLLSVETLQYIAAWVGAVTIVVAASFAVLTNSMKRLLIFHTVSQLGYVVAGMALMTSMGLAGGLLHFVNHMFFKDLLFLSAGAVFVATGIDRMDRLGGLARRMPVTFGCFMIGVLSIAGVPMFSGFVSKWMVYHALAEKGYVGIAVFSLFGSVLTLASFIKFMHSAYLGQLQEHLKDVREVGWTMRLPMIVLAFLSVLLGIMPGLAMETANAVLSGFGLPPLHATLTTIEGSMGSIDMMEITLLLAAGFVAAWLIYKLFVPATRLSHVFMCGAIDMGPKESHVSSVNFYETPKGAIKFLVRLAKRSIGLKGEYIER
jgi:formate hydrogenlyase subunit 3/multisubunit Na+/H+ antiporter MnhD subunit